MDGWISATPTTFHVDDLNFSLSVSEWPHNLFRIQIVLLLIAGSKIIVKDILVSIQRPSGVFSWLLLQSVTYCFAFPDCSSEISHNKLQLQLLVTGCWGQCFNIQVVLVTLSFCRLEFHDSISTPVKSHPNWRCPEGVAGNFTKKLTMYRPFWRCGKRSSCRLAYSSAREVLLQLQAASKK